MSFWLHGLCCFLWLNYVALRSSPSFSELDEPSASLGGRAPGVRRATALLLALIHYALVSDNTEHPSDLSFEAARLAVEQTCWFCRLSKLRGSPPEWFVFRNRYSLSVWLKSLNRLAVVPFDTDGLIDGRNSKSSFHKQLFQLQQSGH